MRQTHRRILVLAATACVGLSASALLADSITLRDGSILTGIVKQLEGGYEIALEDGKRRFVPTEEVKSVKLSNEGKVTEGNARERLLSLQRSVDAERDLDRIIERYEQFATMNANTEAAKLAQAELATWRERRAQGMVKVGHRWLTPGQRDAALVAAAKVVEEACELIAADELAEAAALLKSATAEDPENVSYLYLTGVLQLRRERFTDAKRSFDAVASQIAEHPPTLLNLGVLAVEFKRWAQAVTFLEQAMALAPGSQEILDNVMEFQRLAPESTRRTGGFERLTKRAAPLEAALQERQSQRGLFRHGSQWVDKQTLEKARAQLDAYEKTKVDLEKDYQQSQEAVRKADEQIQLIERMIQRIESESFMVDANGRAVRRRYPDTYWELQRDLERLQEQQRAATKHIADLRKQAEQVKANAPTPPFAGKLSPVDQRGVPVMLPAGVEFNPASQPTTREARDVPALIAAPEPEPSRDLPSTAPSMPDTAAPATAPASSSRGLFE